MSLGTSAATVIANNKYGKARAQMSGQELRTSSFDIAGTIEFTFQWESSPARARSEQFLTNLLRVRESYLTRPFMNNQKGK
jgi:hypothetical protein